MAPATSKGPGQHCSVRSGLFQYWHTGIYILLCYSDSPSERAGGRSYRSDGGVEDKVFFLLDQQKEFIRIQPGERRQGVVIVQIDRACGVEEFHKGCGSFLQSCSEQTVQGAH